MRLNKIDIIDTYDFVLQNDCEYQNPAKAAVLNRKIIDDTALGTE